MKKCTDPIMIFAQMDLVELYLSKKSFPAERKLFEYQTDLYWFVVLKEIGLYYDLRHVISLVMKSLIFKEHDAKYEMLVYDGSWINLTNIPNPLSIDFTNVTEISFAHAGIDPFDYFGLPDQIPNLQYFDLFGNQTSKQGENVVGFDNFNTTLYLNEEIVWRFGMCNMAFPFERTRNIRLLEGAMNENKALYASDVVEMVFIYDGKHVCPAKSHNFTKIGRSEIRYLVLQGYHLLNLHDTQLAYWVYVYNGRVILKKLGELWHKGLILLDDELFDFVRED